MSTEIRELKLSNGKRVFVEVKITDDIRLPDSLGVSGDWPPGAEPPGIRDEAVIGMMLFQENITTMAESVYDSLKNLKPDKWGVEMYIGFKGKSTPIPFIASCELEGGVKVTVTWKKGK